jgi:hypothetical protein
MVERAHAAWKDGHIAGVLLMEITAAFPSVAKGRRVNLMEFRQMNGDHIRCTESCLSERAVEMIIADNAMERHPVEPGVQQCSQVSPIPLAFYTSGHIKWVEKYISKAARLCSVDDLAWIATESDINHTVSLIERCAAKCIEWACRLGLQFDTAQMEVVLFMRRQGHRKHLRPEQTAKISVSSRVIRFNTQGICWQGVWMDAHLMLTEQHTQCTKQSRAPEARLCTLTTTYNIGPDSVRAVQVVCVQAVALYGSELWWDPKDAGRRDDLQLLFNRQARSILGALPTTPQGALMRESGLAPAPVILDSR